MEIKNIKIKDLKPAEYNPRKMSDEELEKLKNSIKEFGLRKAIVVNTHKGRENVIIGGNMTVRALIELGWREIPKNKIDFVSFPEPKEKLLNLALNRITGSWDESKLAKLIREIQDYPDIKLSGLSDAELEMLSVQYDLIFGDDVGDLSNEEEVKKLFALKQRVPIDVERPQVAKRESKIAFYTENFKEWKKITEYFKTKKKSELDTKKLLDSIK